MLYGEWCYGKHSSFYTDLPHYLLEFDLLDTQTGSFLATERRTCFRRYRSSPRFRCFTLARCPRSPRPWP